jgi:5-deoxy-D-glucuronate isomerase
MAKTPGLLGRKKSNFEPTEPYVPEQGQATVETNEVAATVTPSQPTTEEKPTDRNEKRNEKTEAKKKFKNQQGSIKISNQSKEELEVLMKLTNTKFTYEIIDLLIDRYVENELTPEQKRKFKLLTEV